MSALHLCPRAAVTKYYSSGGLNDNTCDLILLEAESKVKVSAGSVSPEASLLGCPRLSSPWVLTGSCFRVSVLTSSFSKDLSPDGPLSRPHVCERSVAQSCPTLCIPMDCGLPGSSVRGISQAENLTGAGCRVLLQGDLPDPGIEPASPAASAWQADSLPWSSQKIRKKKEQALPLTKHSPLGPRAFVCGAQEGGGFRQGLRPPTNPCG